MEVMCARADVDVVLWRERGARGGTIRRVAGGVRRLWGRQVVAHVAVMEVVMLVVRWKGNLLHAFTARGSSTGGATVVRVTMSAS